MEQIAEDSYFLNFIGLTGYHDTLVFDASTLVLLHKRFTVGMQCEINEYLLAHKNDD